MHHPSMPYLLNAPLLTAYGEYRFSGPLSLDAARERVCAGATSAIGHVGAAALLSRLLGIAVPVQRQAIQMQPGDTALVLRLTRRLPEGVVLDADALVAWPHELGWLERLR